jgi:hypothetical protein
MPEFLNGIEFKRAKVVNSGERQRFDRGSRLADPRFMDSARHKYRLAPDSPARAMGDQGKPVGALPD